MCVVEHDGGKCCSMDQGPVFGTKAKAHDYLNIFSLMNNRKYCLLAGAMCKRV